ncbi:MAG: thymidine phosphorylase [Chloroflexi bacterium]|nr:thymidine phosphorylase [Chloroflexota bacterium]
MRIVDLIEKKREGGEHTRSEIEQLVLGFTRGEVPDYQVAAWLMAVVWRGMTPVEAADLTRVMAASGQRLDLASVGRPVADKHSTGGVGDKTSLVVMPLVAACGVPVGKMSGRGLGFTGGTVDKLECFPGMQMDIDARRFVRQLRDVGLVITGQSADLAPADGKLYALRDVTGTVPSLPLIASSIMSKKLASGAHVIVLDVKAGAGAFMKSPAEARALAEIMVAIGRAAGRIMAAVVSDMSQPLGRTVGNALEVREALDTLEGHGPDDLQPFAVELASLIVALATDGLQGREDVKTALNTGAGLAAFRRLVEAQGGDPRAFEDREALPRAARQVPVPAPSDGYLARLDALSVARAATLLGAGRERKGDSVDLAVGVELLAKVGDSVGAGEPLAVLHVNDEQRLAEAQAALLSGMRVSPHHVPRPSLILDRIGS